jgi:glutamine amidotransferase
MSQRMEIVLPNLAIGNFASVLRMVQKVGGSARLVDSPAEIRRAEKIILAGVGAFDSGMGSIRDGGWADALTEAALVRRVPVLGICLGMQLMCKGSDEGMMPGLGWIDGQVKRFNFPKGSPLKVPHMGWNTVTVASANPLIPQADGEQRFYFVHSYYAVCNRPSDMIATAHHGVDFAAAFESGNIFGVQFHPEKSHRFGMAVVRRFVEM